MLKTHQSTVWSAAFNPLSGDEFVTVSDDHSLVIWHTMETSKDDGGQHQARLLNLDELAFRLRQRMQDLHAEAIYSVDWLCHKADGVSLIVTGAADNCIKLMAQDRQGKAWAVLLALEEAHQTDVNWVEFGPRLGPGVYLLASASDDGTVKIWRVETPVDATRFSDDNNGYEYDAAYKDIVNEID